MVVLKKNPESSMAETETKSGRVETENENIKKWSQDQDRSRVLQHYCGVGKTVFKTVFYITAGSVSF